MIARCALAHQADADKLAGGTRDGHGPGKPPRRDAGSEMHFHVARVCCGQLHLRRLQPCRWQTESEPTGKAVVGAAGEDCTAAGDRISIPQRHADAAALDGDRGSAMFCEDARAGGSCVVVKLQIECAAIDDDRLNVFRLVPDRIA